MCVYVYTQIHMAHSMHKWQMQVITSVQQWSGCFSSQILQGPQKSIKPKDTNNFAFMPYPGFISNQASSWLALGASGPNRTLPVSVWVTLTGRSLIWLLSSMGYTEDKTWHCLLLWYSPSSVLEFVAIQHVKPLPVTRNFFTWWVPGGMLEVTFH